MISPHHPAPSRWNSRPKSATRGMALFIVLAVLTLVSILIIGFFLSTTTELKSSQSYASGAGARQLADSATQLVIAQIADATKGGVGSDLLAWASQPGMIRTYDQSGEPAKFYKLYSSDSLILSESDATSFDPANEMPPVGWDTQTGLFTDLNSPITKDGKVHFPIIDPRAKTSDPKLSVEGFDYRSDVNGVVLPGGGVDNQRLPMPVRWLYVLQNGKLAIPLSSSGGVVSFDSSVPERAPTKDNPIVGRIAFWTDDETAKININTASEGTFWDRPWANTTTEQNLATAIPGQNEFQRYPGHPAKTSLSTVLQPVLPAPSPAWYLGMSASQQAENQKRLKAYYDLVPRVADGGTKGGTINETDSAGNPNSAFNEIVPDADRLYASVDEFLFSPNFSSTRTSNNPVIDNAVLEKTKFFLTAHSRAPELNLFGRPRMTLWPIQRQESLRNAKDKLIAFCSTIGGYPYYFQRYNAYSEVGLANASSQSPTLDWTGVQRNQELYKYLDGLTQKEIPGFGGSFSDKYSSTRRQILTQMFDQIRSGVNAYSTGLSPQYGYAPKYLDPGEGQVVPLIPPGGTPGAGTRGFGRFSTVIGSAIVFHRNNAAKVTMETVSPGPPPVQRVVVNSALITLNNPNGVVTTPKAQIGATLILNPMTVSPGFPPWSPNLQYVVTGLDEFTINGKKWSELGVKSELTNKVTSRAEYSGQANCGPLFGIISNFRYSNGTLGDKTKTAGTGNAETQYPFTIPIAIELPDGATKFNFNTDSPAGHTIKITIYAGADEFRTNPIQTIEMNYPPVPDMPVPTVDPTNFVSYFNRLIDNEAYKLGRPYRRKLIQYYPIPSTKPPYDNNVASLGTDKEGNPITYWVQDVARGVQANSLSPAKGDYRVYAALFNVPSSFFAPLSAYNSEVDDPHDPLGGKRQEFSNVQSLWDAGLDSGGAGGFGYDASVPGGYHTHFPQDTAGSDNGKGNVTISSLSTGVLIPKNKLAAYGGGAGRGSTIGEQEYRGMARPAVPPGLAGAFLSGGSDYGDWDNMTGLLGDGPFINKPDEGNSDTVSDTKNRTDIDVYYGSKEIAGGYFSTGVADVIEYKADTGKTFSPNRQISSAVLFGSLPTGIDPSSPSSARPWQTLAFSPNPLGKTAHPGLASPPDYLFLDLFNMPIVEPYAISEPFSTAGKVNMNYQIMPFSYIQRSTGVRAVLKATRLMAIPQSMSTVTANMGNSYKDGKRGKYEFRYDINPDEKKGTLAGFETRFTAGDIFRSAAEISSIFLVPQKIPSLSTGMSYPPEGTPPSSYEETQDWWDNFLLTGDNTREAPYGDIYARLTTKSNTFTVHYRVQSLRKVISTPADQWVEGRDQITGEMRGSTTIERYIDVGAELPDFAADSAPSAEGFYRFRTVRSTIFNP